MTKDKEVLRIVDDFPDGVADSYIISQTLAITQSALRRHRMHVSSQAAIERLLQRGILVRGAGGLLCRPGSIVHIPAHPTLETGIPE